MIDAIRIKIRILQNIRSKQMTLTT